MKETYKNISIYGQSTFGQVPNSLLSFVTLSQVIVEHFSCVSSFLLLLVRRREGLLSSLGTKLNPRGSLMFSGSSIL